MFFTENSKHESQVEEYSQLWDFDGNRHKYVIEASTGYSKFPFEGNVPQSMKEYGISPRFIYVVRDPFQRIESQYNFSVGKWWFSPNASMTNERYVSLSRYFTQLEQYRNYFEKERITIVDFDDLVQNPPDTVATLCGILGIQYFAPPDPGLHQNKTELPTRGKELIDQTYQKLKQMPLLQTLSDKMPWHLKHALLRQMEGCLATLPVLSQRRKKRTLNDQERAIIRDKIENDMYNFKKEYGFPVEKWGFRFPNESGSEKR